MPPKFETDRERKTDYNIYKILLIWKVEVWV